MATRSKVWPALSRDSLNLSQTEPERQQPTSSPPPPQRDEEEGKFLARSPVAKWWLWRRGRRRRRPSSIDDLASRVDGKQTVGYYLRRCCGHAKVASNERRRRRGGCFTCWPPPSSSSSSPWTIDGATFDSCSCSPATSDIFCVAGAITVITGSLIAGFGVFPRNQARIRLYLECIGCAMVIMGMLIVFVSKRMKQHPAFKQRNNNHHEAADFWLNSEDLAPAARGRKKAVNLAQRSLSLATITNNRIHRQPSLDLETANLTATTGGGTWRRPTTRLQANNIGADSISSPAIVERWQDWGDGKLEVGGGGGGDSGPGLATRAASDSIVALATPPASHEMDGSHWIPDDDDGYGEDHQAAIEAALSTVLTVSTLVGFRPDPDCAHNHCCLHHAVQHKMNARKWLNKLRRATVAAAAAATRHQLSVPCGGNGNVVGMLMGAETTLIECSSLQANLNMVEKEQHSHPQQLAEFNKLDQQQQREANDLLPPLT